VTHMLVVCLETFRLEAVISCAAAGCSQVLGVWRGISLFLMDVISPSNGSQPQPFNL